MELERMGAFFDSRLNDYEAHQLNCIASARAFYPYTASLLPEAPGCEVLDLGCGTGLELGAYFLHNPDAQVTGIDLSEGMLGALRAKFPNRRLSLIRGSYFDVPLRKGVYDAAVSVESLHHFTQQEKAGLYRKLCAALKADGYFVLTDYTAADDTEEARGFAELARLKAEQGAAPDALYHYDTPLTCAHEMEALSQGGFARVELVRRWGATCTFRAAQPRG